MIISKGYFLERRDIMSELSSFCIRVSSAIESLWFALKWIFWAIYLGWFVQK